LASLILRPKFNIYSLYFQPFMQILSTSFTTYFKAYSVFVQTLIRDVQQLMLQSNILLFKFKHKDWRYVG
ncbi:hypothetical protein, partial [uncultured Candidatus Kuenenia sp.]|uniref:hypothetical protein n=1 Tax=uncultured Candidatus Kuenenia sp. TaxID=1048336 RepID=UPI0025DCF50C